MKKNNNTRFKGYDRQERRTFEDTLENQNLLRKKLEELIKENRPVEPEEREDIFDMVAHATLGTARKRSKPFKLNDKGYLGTIYNLEGFFRRACYFESNVLSPKTLDFNQVEPLPISFLWKVFLFELLDIFPAVLEMSARMSREMDILDTSGGLPIGTKTRN